MLFQLVIMMRIINVPSRCHVDHAKIFLVPIESVVVLHYCLPADNIMLKNPNPQHFKNKYAIYLRVNLTRILYSQILLMNVSWASLSVLQWFLGIQNNVQANSIQQFLFFFGVMGVRAYYWFTHDYFSKLILWLYSDQEGINDCNSVLGEDYNSEKLQGGTG